MAAGDAPYEGLKDYLCRLVGSYQVCKLVIVSGLVVLFYDWGEQSASSKMHTQSPCLPVISIDWEVCGVQILYLSLFINSSQVTIIWVWSSSPEPATMKAN